MRITPNHPHLRLIALCCWVAASASTITGKRLILSGADQSALGVGYTILGCLIAAVGVAFWLIGKDARAGIIFDSKGLMLNLGYSSSFVAWRNIERVGLSRRSAGLFSLGSTRHFGIVLKDPEPYIQSYEERLPASTGLAASVLRLIADAFAALPGAQRASAPTEQQLADCHRHTGYHILVPEAFLGGKAADFVQLVEQYRRSPPAAQASTSLAF